MQITYPNSVVRHYHEAGYTEGERMKIAVMIVRVLVGIVFLLPNL